MQRAEIRPGALDPAAGHEQEGCRPVVLPSTSGGSFARTAGFAVQLTGAGTKTTGVVRCDQPRALDLRARSGRKLEEVPEAIMNEALARLAPIFE